MISLCNACKYGQTDKCTRKDRNITKECYIPFSGESIAEKEIRADEREKVIEKINIAEDKLVSCYKNTKDIMTIRMAFAEMRESLNS